MPPSIQSSLVVPYAQSVHGEDEIKAVVNVLQTSTQMGKHVQEFEQSVAQLFDKKHGVMVNSGSSALMIAIDLFRFQEGDEIITPALTFSTTVAPLVRARLIPAFVDVEENTYNINVNKIEEMITPKTKGLVIPNLLGNLPDWDRIRELASHYHLKVLEDSCDTLGAILRGVSTGSRSDISATSFYGSHIINCAGNGGLLCMNDPDLSTRGKLLRSWGRSSSKFNNQESEQIQSRFDVQLGGIDYDRKFLFEEIGYNFEPSEVGAAFGLVQLKKLKDFLQSRRQRFVEHLNFFKQYEEFFALPREIEGTKTGWLAFPLTIRPSAPFNRRDFQIYLEKNNIQTRPIFTGNVMRQPGFSTIQCKENQYGYPQADQIMRGGVLIACHQGLKDEQMHYIHTKVEEFFRKS